MLKQDNYHSISNLTEVYRGLTIPYFRIWWVTICGVHIFTLWLSPHHACIALDQPISYFALCWHHLCRSGRGLGGGLLTLLAKGKLGHMVFDLQFTWTAFIKLNGERGVALDHRRRGRGGDKLCGIWGILCRHLVNLRVWAFCRFLQEFLCWDLKVAGLSTEGEHGLGLSVWLRTVHLMSWVIFSRLCCKKGIKRKW